VNRVGKYLSWREFFAEHGIMPTANDGKRQVLYLKGKALIFQRVGRKSDKSEYNAAMIELDKHLGV
jgi:hypothetical protein